MLRFNDEKNNRKLVLQGTHRSVSTHKTIERVKPHLRAAGITRVANITGLDILGIPVITVNRPNSRSVTVDQGKGISIENALASGLMESIESYHAEYIDLPLIYCEEKKLAYKHRTVSIEQLPRPDHSHFDERFPIFWIKAFELLEAVEKYVPYELVHTNFTVPTHAGNWCFYPSSNGLASGNTIEEAINHGITEVIERDSLAIWETHETYNSANRRLNTETINDEINNNLIETIVNKNMSLAIWDITSDVQIPCFVCWLLDNNDPNELTSIGSGCHVSKSVALSRAITESAQNRLALISGSRDDIQESDYLPVDQDIKELRQDIINNQQQRRSYLDVPTYETETLSEDLQLLKVQLNNVGVEEILVVELTKFDKFDIPVARVIIPGLEPDPDCFGYKPGKRAKHGFILFP